MDVGRNAFIPVLRGDVGKPLRADACVVAFEVRVREVGSFPDAIEHPT
jgi:hypothetical protein